MSVELGAALVGFIIAVTTLVKVITDKIKLTTDRAETKKVRDADSQELHDKVLKLEFMTTQLKDNQSLNATAIDDLRDQTATLNVNIVKLDMAVAQLTEAIKSLKESK